MVFRKGVDNLEDLQPNLRFLHDVTSALQHYNWKQHQHFINTFQHYRLALNLHFQKIRNVVREQIFIGFCIYANKTTFCTLFMKCCSTEIEGLRIHFIRVVHPSSYKRIYPIMLLHGLQSSFWEFYKVRATTLLCLSKRCKKRVQAILCLT